MLWLLTSNVMYRRGIGLFCTQYTLVLASDSLVTLIYIVLIFIIMIKFLLLLLFPPYLSLIHI